MVRIWSHGIELPKEVGHRALKVGQAQKQYLAEVQALFSSHEYRSVILSNQSHRHTEFGDLECLGRLCRHWPAWGQVARLPRITGISLQGKRFRSLVEPDPFMVLHHECENQSPYPTGMGSTELVQRSAAVASYFKNPVVVVYIPHFQWFEQGALFHFKLRTSVLFLLFSGYLRWLSAQIFMPSSWDWALDNQEYKVMKPERKEAKK